MGTVLKLPGPGFPIDRFESGQEIFSEGSKADNMFVVCSGEVSIERAGITVEHLSAGDIFGEMALIDGSPRSATARAKTHCEVAPITQQAFQKLLLETPLFALTVMRTLADRLRRTR
jgi:CRP/FNR family transcriptional regulator, cyclic AMP receptor protein